MKKRKLQAHHLYLGAGGMLAVAALVIALTFGLSSAQSGGDPCPGDACPNVCCGGDAGGGADPCPGDACPGICCAGGGQPATITCPNGETRPTYNDCPKCPDGVTTIPAGGCPQQQNTCQGGTPIRCPDNSCAATAIACPCAVGMMRCPDQTCAATCPQAGGNQMTQCPNGTSVPVGTACPSTGGQTACPSATPVRCPDNTCASSAATCPQAGGQNACPVATPIRCPDNSCRVTAAECTGGQTACPPTRPTWATDPSCQCNPTTGFVWACTGGTMTCPSATPIKCPDGSCRVAAADCGMNTQQCAAPTPFKCPDGRCVTSSEVCGGQNIQCPSAMPIDCGGYCAKTRLDCGAPPPTTGDMGACTASGKVWCPGQMGAPGWCKGEPGPCPGAGSMCPWGQHMDNGRCVQDMRGMEGEGDQMMPPMPDFNMEMLECENEWGMIDRMPKVFYDCTANQGDSCNPPPMNTMGSPQPCVEKQMTCESWQAQRKMEQARAEKCAKTMGPNRGPNMPMMNPNMRGAKGDFRATFDCSQDYTNPLCKAGQFGQEGFKEYENVYENMDTSGIKLGKNLAQEVRRLKQEAVIKSEIKSKLDNLYVEKASLLQALSTAKNPREESKLQRQLHEKENRIMKEMNSACYSNPMRPKECDIYDAKQQLEQLSLQAGIACPAAVQVQSIIDQSQAVLDEIRSLSEKASKDEITQAWAKFDTLRGGPNGQGILSKLFGNPDPETCERQPGLMQSLDTCRQIGFVTRDAQRELSNFKHMKDTEEYKALEKFASNPLAFLPEGVDIFAPMDPSQCGGGNMMAPIPPSNICQEAEDLMDNWGDPKYETMCLAQKVDEKCNKNRFSGPDFGPMDDQGDFGPMNGQGGMGPMNGQGGMGPMNDQGGFGPMNDQGGMGNFNFNFGGQGNFGPAMMGGQNFDPGMTMPMPMPMNTWTTPDFGGGSAVNYGQDSVLLSQFDSDEEDMNFGFGEEEEEDFVPEMNGPMGGPMGPGCGFFEPEFQMDEECMPPAQRYLGMPHGAMKDLIKALVNKGCEFEQEKHAEKSCDGIGEFAKKFPTKSRVFPPPVAKKVKSLIDAGTKACEKGDNEIASANFRMIMPLWMQFDRGPMMNFVKFDKQDYADIGERNDLEDDELKLLKAEIALLKDQLAAMDQKVQDLLAETAKLNIALGEAKNMLAALGVANEQVARMTGNDATNELGRVLSERSGNIIAVANESIPAVPQEAKEVIAEIINEVAGGISSSAETQVTEVLDALSAQVNSGAMTNAQEVTAVKAAEKAIEAIVTSPAEFALQRAEGVNTFADAKKDTWVGGFAAIAVTPEYNLASPANTILGVGNPETWNQAIVRSIRLVQDTPEFKKSHPEYFVQMEKLEEFEDRVSSADKESEKAKVEVERQAYLASIPLTKELPGALPFVRSFLAACQKDGAEECINPPVANLTEPIEREEMASLIVGNLQAAGVELPPVDDVAPPMGVDPKYVEDVKIAKEIGIMGGRTGPDDPDFNGSGEMTVGMDIVVAVNTKGYINAASGTMTAGAPAVRSSAPAGDDDFGFDMDLFGEEEEEGDTGIIDPIFDNGINNFGDGGGTGW